MSRSLALTKARSMKARRRVDSRSGHAARAGHESGPSGARARVDDSCPLPNSLKRARRPLRERGRTRFQALLEATESLLKEGNPTILVYIRSPSEPVLRLPPCITFFQPKNAALLALAEKYHAVFPGHGERADRGLAIDQLAGFAGGSPRTSGRVLQFPPPGSENLFRDSSRAGRSTRQTRTTTAAHRKRCLNISTACS